MATFESGGFSMALEKIATDSAESAYNPIHIMKKIQIEHNQIVTLENGYYKQ